MFAWDSICGFPDFYHHVFYPRLQFAVSRFKILYIFCFLYSYIFSSLSGLILYHQAFNSLFSFITPRPTPDRPDIVLNGLLSYSYIFMLELYSQYHLFPQSTTLHTVQLSPCIPSSILYFSFCSLLYCGYTFLVVFVIVLFTQGFLLLATFSSGDHIFPVYPRAC